MNRRFIRICRSLIQALAVTLFVAGGWLAFRHFDTVLWGIGWFLVKIYENRGGLLFAAPLFVLFWRVREMAKRLERVVEVAGRHEYDRRTQEDALRRIQYVIQARADETRLHVGLPPVASLLVEDLSTFRSTPPVQQSSTPEPAAVNLRAAVLEAARPVLDENRRAAQAATVLEVQARIAALQKMRPEEITADHFYEIGALVRAKETSTFLTSGERPTAYDRIMRDDE